MRKASRPVIAEFSLSAGEHGDVHTFRVPTSDIAQEAEDVFHSTGAQVPLVLKNLERLSDVLGLQRAAPTGGDQQGSRSQGVQATLYGNPSGATFVDEKDCRFGCFSRNQNCLGLASGDVMRLLELDSRSHRDTTRRYPATVLDFGARARVARLRDFAEHRTRDHDIVEEMGEQIEVAGLGQCDEWAGVDDQPHAGLRSFVCLFIQRSVDSSAAAS